jgi:hypothetical protein
MTFSTLSLAAEQPNELDPVQEAMSTANQFHAISQTIKSKGSTILALGEAHSALNITMAGKIKAIFQAIELQRENLVNTVMNGISTNNSETINSIVTHLESEQQSLSNLIAPELESTPDLILNPSDKKEIATSFQIYK